MSNLNTVATAGCSLDDADQIVILLHGRGATPNSMRPLAVELGDDATCILLPAASSGSWYPEPFTAPIAENEPWRSVALTRLNALRLRLENDGFDTDRIFLGGFSQGACLALEYAAHHPAGYGGVFGFSGGLLGDSIDPASYQGDMAGAPVFLGCGDSDPHIPATRVRETAAVFESLHAQVDTRLYEELGHTVNPDEIKAVRTVLHGRND